MNLLEPPYSTALNHPVPQSAAQPSLAAPLPTLSLQVVIAQEEEELPIAADREPSLSGPCMDCVESLTTLAGLLTTASETLFRLGKRAAAIGEPLSIHGEGLFALGEAFSDLSDTLLLASENFLDTATPLSQSLLEQLRRLASTKTAPNRHGA